MESPERLAKLESQVETIKEDVKELKADIKSFASTNISYEYSSGEVDNLTPVHYC